MKILSYSSHTPQKYSWVVCPRSLTVLACSLHMPRAPILHCMRSLPYSPVSPHPSSPSLHSHHTYHTPLRYLRLTHTHPMLIQPTLHTLNPSHASLSLPSHTPSTLITFCSSAHSTLNSPHPSHEFHAPTLMLTRITVSPALPSPVSLDISMYPLRAS